MNLEYLRHGKALCGKVFRRFVETFNFHNDFISNLKGDADLPVVGGKVRLDRTDERHPVIRCQGCGNGGGGGEEYKSVLPWSFSCAEDPETGERTGGWRNGRLQVGLECGWRSPDIDGLKPEDVEPEEGSEDETTFPYVTGCGQCEDADYYLEINISKNTAKVVASNEDSRLEPTDPRNNVVRVFLGTVTEGRLNEEAAIHMNPVIYKYL